MYVRDDKIKYALFTTKDEKNGWKRLRTYESSILSESEHTKAIQWLTGQAVGWRHHYHAFLDNKFAIFALTTTRCYQPWLALPDSMRLVTRV